MNRIEELTLKTLDDELSAGEDRELSDLVQQDGESAGVYCSMLRLDAELRVAGLDLDVAKESMNVIYDVMSRETQEIVEKIALDDSLTGPGNFSPTTRSPVRRRRWVLPLAAAAIVMVALGLFAWLGRPSGGEVVARAGESVRCSVFGVQGRAKALSLGMPLYAGDRVEVGGRGRVKLKYEQDGTVVHLREGAKFEVRDLKLGYLETGRLDAVVARQADGHSFVVTTPHAKVTVLGTRLKLMVDAEKSRLEVEKGAVRLERLSDGQTALVKTGRYVVVAKGENLYPRMLAYKKPAMRPGWKARAKKGAVKPKHPEPLTTEITLTGKLVKQERQVGTKTVALYFLIDEQGHKIQIPKPKGLHGVQLDEHLGTQISLTGTSTIRLTTIQEIEKTEDVKRMNNPVEQKGPRPPGRRKDRDGPRAGREKGGTTTGPERP